MNGKPLNPGLYEVLRRHFGRVKIQNAGSPFRYTYTHLAGGGARTMKISGGEEYAVCCPFCGDKRFRLNINHMFGSRLKSGHLVQDAAHCWNESCPGVADLILRLLEGVPMESVHSEVLDSYTMEDAIRDSHQNHLKLAHTIMVDQLPPNHPAALYLEGRGFNLGTAANRYGVQYCASKVHHYAYRRLVFPLVWELDKNPVVVGWQARAVPNHTLRMEPKYWTSPGCQRSLFLWDFLAARKYSFLIVVEGPTDVMRIGRPAVGLLGRTLSCHQQSLIYRTFRDKDGPIILIGDPGFEEDWGVNKEKLDRMFSMDSENDRVLMFTMENDPGSTDSSELWSCIVRKAKERGYDICKPSF